jgi:hypothetical protein
MIGISYRSRPCLMSGWLTIRNGPIVHCPCPSAPPTRWRSWTRQIRSLSNFVPRMPIFNLLLDSALLLWLLLFYHPYSSPVPPFFASLRENRQPFRHRTIFLFPPPPTHTSNINTNGLYMCVWILFIHLFIYGTKVVFHTQKEHLYSRCHCHLSLVGGCICMYNYLIL